MRGGDWHDFGGIVRTRRRPARAFRPGWIANELEVRLLPATLTLTPTSLPGDTLGTAYNQNITATGGTAPYTFALANNTTLPAGLTLNASTGAITGTPTATGTSNFTITATDSATPTANTGSQNYSVTINPALTFTTTTLPGATINTAYMQQLGTSGGTTPISFALANNTTLPAGLTLSTAGLISGTPTATGSSTFTVKATDAANTTATQNYTLMVSAAATTITIAPNTLPGATAGTAYNQQLTATGGTAPITFAVTTGSLPNGLNLSSIGAITGTPTAAGSSTFTVTATDANHATATQNYTLTVSAAAAAITLSPSTLPGATAGTPYSQQITGTGGTGTLTFALTSGSLPAGLTLSNAGALSGTPTTAGSSIFTVTATDTAGATGSHQYTLDVASGAATTGPTVTSLKRYGFHAQPTIFKLAFNTALDPTSAQDVTNYTLVPLHNGTAGTPITLSSATYDATTNTVTLTPAHNVYLYAQYRLTVNGTSPSGVQDTSGNFLAGANGQSGTNYVKTFGKEILSGPNIPSGTPTARANFINNEWTNELAARFTALAAAAGDTTTATTASTQSAAASAVRVVSQAAPAVALPASGALMPNAARPDAIGAVLGAIVLPDQEKKK